MDAFTLFNIGVDGFALIMLAILLYTLFISFDNTQDIRYLKNSLAVVMLILFSDLSTWFLIGKRGSMAHFFLYLTTFLYYFSQVYSAIAWRDYVWYRVERKVKSKDNIWATVVLPVGAILVVLLTNPLTGYTFTITEDNQYIRGPLSPVIAIIVFLYMLATSIWILYKRKREMLASTRREYLILAGFIIPPGIGAAIQMSTYGISLIWPCCALSLLNLFLNRSHDEISIDALTGLNNRGSLDKYLLEHVNEESGDRLTLMIMDVDKFKLINDDLGHDMGDVALREISEVIRQTFGKDDNFVARFGGDEFIVVISQVNDPRIIDNYVRSLRSNLESFNATGTFPMKLSISLGIAYYPKEGITTPEALLKAADEHMYEEKQRHHAEMGYKRS